MDNDNKYTAINPGTDMMVNNVEEQEFFLSHLKPNMRVLEFGSGMSTIQIASRVKEVVSIEHNKQWFDEMKDKMPPNAKLYYVPANSEPKPEYDDGTYEDFRDYVDFPFSLIETDDDRFDVCFVDGRSRVACAAIAANHYVKFGGFIFIHDIRHPDPQYRRFEYDAVDEFLEHLDGVFAMHLFAGLPHVYKPKQIFKDIEPINTSPIHTEKTPKDQNICWNTEECIESMNIALENFYKTDRDLQHLKVFEKLLWETDERSGTVLDIGTGTGMISEYCKNFEFVGADLPHIIAGCAMKWFPQHLYRSLDIINDDISWIKDYKVVIANGFVDVMEDPLNILGKILESASSYVILHRQEITTDGQTRSIQKPSYNSKTWHSIINRKDFEKLIDHHNFEITHELSCGFADWENNGTSFLLRKRKSWALYEIDFKLDKLFEGKREGIFIEAGANDGLTQSNTMFLERYRNWKGILIEPIPDLYIRCLENRSQQSIVENYALVGHDSYDYGDMSIDMIYTPESNGLLSVIDNEKAPELMKRTKEVGKKIRVPASLLDWVLRMAKGYHKMDLSYIDLLSLDVEGNELEALKGIDFDKWNIQYLLIEELSGSDEIKDHLSPWYSQVGKLSEHDYLYKKIE